MTTIKITISEHNIVLFIISTAAVLLSTTLNSQLFKAGWNLIGCQCFYCFSAGKKSLFFCAVIVIVEV